MTKKRHGLEKSTEKWMKDYIKGLGGECIKLTLLAGIPDRMVLLPRGKVCFIETKTPIGQMSELQIWWQGRLAALGFPVAGLCHKESIKALIDGLHNNGLGQHT